MYVLCNHLQPIPDDLRFQSSRLPLLSTTDCVGTAISAVGLKVSQYESAVAEACTGKQGTITV